MPRPGRSVMDSSSAREAGKMIEGDFVFRIILKHHGIAGRRLIELPLPEKAGGQIQINFIIILAARLQRLAIPRLGPRIVLAEIMEHAHVFGFQRISLRTDQSRQPSLEG